MCGIVGFSGKAQKGTIDKMMSSIIHRGPDDGAKLETEHFTIGFRRLAIIDLSKNIYPLTNEMGTIQCFLNGEIYNYLALKQDLENKGHQFKTHSDTEVIVHGFEEWGLKVLEHLRGMFVIVLFNKNKNELIIARDRLGIKPLYYSELNKNIIFGSEIKSLFAGFEINREPNNNVIYKFLTKRLHDIDKNTFFKNVKKLPPGFFMLIDKDNNYRLEKYWNPDFNPSFSSKKSDNEYSHEFKEVFTEAINLHLIADVPVGVTLSGGLDSSGITSLASKLYKEKNTNNEIYAFSAIYPGETINEESYIDNVVNYTGVKSVKITPTLEGFWEDIDNWIYFQEEPVISAAPYAYYSVMREARKYVTVLLTGQGGDELLAGYIPYFLTYLESAIDDGNFYAALRETLRGSDLYTKYFIDILEQRLKKIFNKEDTSIKNRVKDMINLSSIIEEENVLKKTRNLNERLFQDVTSLTTPSLLRYEDKNSMANSLESRVPFFDHKVVEYIFNLPIDQKIKYGWNRYIYRQTMKNIIPEKNRLRRSKIGFTNPEWEWIQRKQNNYIEVFESDVFRSRPYWNAENILKNFKLTLEGKLTGDLLFFWRVFSVEKWLRTYVDNFKVLDTSKLIFYRNS